MRSSSILTHPISKDYWSVLKPRVMILSIFSAAIGMLVAPGYLSLPRFSIALLAIAMGAGAAGALNMWCEVDQDRLMKRTQGRALPSDRLSGDEVLTFATMMGVLGVMLLGVVTNWIAAGLLAGTILFYIGVYTLWLKPNTPNNIVVGGAAGALPPVVGWAAVTGSADYGAWILFTIIFFWTPAHFWALSLMQYQDYGRAGFPMLPNFSNAQTTLWHILGYSVLIAFVSLLPWSIGMVGGMYATGAVLMGVGFIALAVWACWDRTLRAYRLLFAGSILHLFMLLVLMGIDH